MAAVFDARFKLVATPGERGGSHALYDRRLDPAETRDASAREAEVARRLGSELARYLQACQREAAATAKRLAGAPGTPKLSPEACENMKALGYVDEGCAP
jgi:hypothetical protein